MLGQYRFVATAISRASPFSMSTFIPKKVTPGVIIGAGRIGSHLYEANGHQDILLNRNDPFPQKCTSGPIYVCVRNDDLEDVIRKVPISRRSDMVFLQNGIIEPILRKYYIEDCATQALIYYGIAKTGDKPIDGKTKVNPEGLTAVTGKWSSDFATRLQHAGLTCNIKDRQTFQIAMVSLLTNLSFEFSFSFFIFFLDTVSIVGKAYLCLLLHVDWCEISDLCG